MKRVKVVRRAVIPLLMLIAGFDLGTRIDSDSTLPVQTAALEASSVSDELEAVKSFSEALIEVSEQVNPTVVTIFSEKTVKATFPGFNDSPLREFFGDEFSRRFFGIPDQDREFKQRGLGSGVIVRSDGYILTNNHVVAGADKIIIGLGGGEEMKGEIVGTDRATDIAVVKIDKEGLQSARLGDSEDIRVGEWVVAIGNPFGLEHTVTAGIISYKGRSNVRIADYEDFIQTDAAINPGNSGGPLVNLDGEVIGINTAIATNTGAYQGVGFAIPISLAKRIMEELIRSGRVVRGWLGIYIQDITQAMAEAMDLPTREGVLVADVREDGPSKEAGLQRGDVILEFNGKKMKNGLELRNTVASTSPGTKVDLKILRDGKTKKLTVKLGELPSEEMAAAGGGRDILSDLGLRLHNLNSELGRRYGISGDKGVVVVDVYPGSAAAEAGFVAGDLIVEVNQEEVESVTKIQERLSALEPGDSVLFLVERGRGTLFVAMKIPE